MFTVLISFCNTRYVAISCNFSQPVFLWQFADSVFLLEWYLKEFSLFVRTHDQRLTLLNILFVMVELIVIWIIVSVPVYIAGKVVTADESTLGDAMIATLSEPIVYAVTLFLVGFLLGSFLGSSVNIWALVLHSLGMGVQSQLQNRLIRCIGNCHTRHNCFRSNRLHLWLVVGRNSSSALLPKVLNMNSKAT